MPSMMEAPGTAGKISAIGVKMSVTDAKMSATDTKMWVTAGKMSATVESSSATGGKTANTRTRGSATTAEVKAAMGSGKAVSTVGSDRVRTAVIVQGLTELSDHAVVAQDQVAVQPVASGAAEDLVGAAVGVAMGANAL